MLFQLKEKKIFVQVSCECILHVLLAVRWQVKDGQKGVGGKDEFIEKNLGKTVLVPKSMVSSVKRTQFDDSQQNISYA